MLLISMTRTYRIHRSSLLHAPPGDVWRHATHMASVNRELRPLARMSYPPAAAVLSAGEEQLGRPLFRATIYVLGLLPVDYDDLTLVEFTPPTRFLERSSMLSQSRWQHERIVEPHPGGCRITDRVEFVPRLALLGPIYRATFAAAFSLRHRNLRRMFGGSPA